jgi:hypothetical protein
VTWAPVILIALGAAGVLSAYLIGRNDGQQSIRNEQNQRGLKAAERIANADAHAPADRADLVERLRKRGGL